MACPFSQRDMLCKSKVMSEVMSVIYSDVCEKHCTRGALIEDSCECSTEHV